LSHRWLSSELSTRPLPDIYFDLDGTLTDPFEGISKSIIYAMRRLGEPEPDNETLRGCIGPPLLASFEALVGDAHARDALTFYRERFGDIGWQENIPYPGIHNVLQQLKDSNRTLFVATSKPTVYAERIVSHFRLREYFDGVFGSELDGRRTRKVELLEYALAACNSTQAVMVGDRSHDVIGALRNNMDIIGVSYGYGTTEELKSAGAEQIADSPEELVAYLLEG
jgi:phosphoglycolate phosphatase